MKRGTRKSLLSGAHPCFRSFCSFSMSPLSLIVADYRYQVHFSTPRFAGVSKTTRHGEYGKQRWKIAMHRWFQCAFIRNTVVNGAQHRYLHQSQFGNAFRFKHRIEWAQPWSKSKETHLYIPDRRKLVTKNVPFMCQVRRPISSPLTKVPIS